MIEFGDLPDDVLYHMLSFLDIKDLVNVSDVSSHLKSVVKGRYAWNRREVDVVLSLNFPSSSTLLDNALSYRVMKLSPKLRSLTLSDSEAKRYPKDVQITLFARSAVLVTKISNSPLIPVRNLNIEDLYIREADLAQLLSRFGDKLEELNFRRIYCVSGEHFKRAFPWRSFDDVVRHISNNPSDIFYGVNDHRNPPCRDFLVDLFFTFLQNYDDVLSKMQLHLKTLSFTFHYRMGIFGVCFRRAKSLFQVLPLLETLTVFYCAEVGTDLYIRWKKFKPLGLEIKVADDMNHKINLEFLFLSTGVVDIFDSVEELSLIFSSRCKNVSVYLRYLSRFVKLRKLTIYYDCRNCREICYDVNDVPYFYSLRPSVVSKQVKELLIIGCRSFVNAFHCTCMKLFVHAKIELDYLL